MHFGVPDGLLQAHISTCKSTDAEPPALYARL